MDIAQCTMEVDMNDSISIFVFEANFLVFCHRITTENVSTLSKQRHKNLQPQKSRMERISKLNIHGLHANAHIAQQYHQSTQSY